jgi:hypothetical protein
MGLFDDIVPPDSAPSYVATPTGVPRITVRPQGVEPPPGPGNASQAPADAPDGTDNAPPARSGGLFDDIVPPADTPAPDMPTSDGDQFAAPLPDGRNFRVAREGFSPPAGFVDRLTAVWENPPKDRPSLIGLIKSAYEGATLPGNVLSGKTPIMGPDGHTSDEVISRATDLAQVYPLRGAPGGFFGRPIKDRVANPRPKAEGALSGEAAAAPRVTIAPAVPPRQVLAEASDHQGVPIPRAPPRPPDKAATQSDRMKSGARESGPFDSKARPAEASPTGKFYRVAFEMKLKLPSLRKSRPHHFQEANEALLRAMESHPEFARAMQQLGITMKRTPAGLAPRTPPAGWTWHHAQEPGVMQLVPRPQHKPGTILQGVLHPSGRGGYSRWGK